ncbi:polysaccharide deacetylase family protein [Cytobacillus suaedae]|nr:polysaccharide deacetylase family protein [Cytobacillus suaedae]
MRKQHIIITVLLVLFLVLFGDVKQPILVEADDSKQDTLYKEIVDNASQYEIPAIDAKIDPVWKATPGYNGLKVDIEASYKKMKKNGVFDEGKLVLKQVEPKVKLKDLPPEPIYRGNPNKKMVSFIINVAWGNEYIPSMLETLKKHNVKASFFLEGRWVKENPEIAKMISDAGHEVGNHSYTHPDLKTLATEEVREQLTKTNKVIEATIGKKPTLFGPPSGSFRPEVVKIASESNMRTILWSVDTIDWQRPQPSVIINRVIGKIHPGALILMHPTESTATALETLILSLKKKEYSINNVSTLLSEERVSE